MIRLSNIQLLLVAFTAVNCCITEVKHATWDFDPSIGAEVPYVKTVSDCRALCFDYLGNCRGYTFNTNGVVGTCYLFTELSGIHACETCSSGVTYEVVQGACSFNEDNELTEVFTNSAEECFHQCVDNPECQAFTWYDSSTPFKNVCFLFRTCDDVAICAGCQSGRVDCIESPQCYQHSLLSEESRHHNVLTQGDDIWFSDVENDYRTSTCWMGPGYYRVVLPAGTMIAEGKPALNACGTDRGGYLDAGSHPEEEGIEVDRTVKIVDVSSTYDITITKCPGGFYVYYLPNTTSSTHRYCSM